MRLGCLFVMCTVAIVNQALLAQEPHPEGNGAEPPPVVPRDARDVMLETIGTMSHMELQGLLGLMLDDPSPPPAAARAAIRRGFLTRVGGLPRSADIAIARPALCPKDLASVVSELARGGVIRTDGASEVLRAAILLGKPVNKDDLEILRRSRRRRVVFAAELAAALLHPSRDDWPLERAMLHLRDRLGYLDAWCVSVLAAKVGPKEKKNHLTPMLLREVKLLRSLLGSGTPDTIPDYHMNMQDWLTKPADDAVRWERIENMVELLLEHEFPEVVPELKPLCGREDVPDMLRAKVELALAKAGDADALTRVRKRFAKDEGLALAPVLSRIKILQLDKKDVLKGLRQLLSNPEWRGAALHALCKLDAAEAEKELSKLCTSTDPLDQARLVEAACRLVPDSAVARDILMSRIRKDGSQDTEVLYGLSKLSGVRVPVSATEH